MTEPSQHWWHDLLDPQETVLWSDHPSQRFVPPQFALIYQIALGCLGVFCLILPWISPSSAEAWTMAVIVCSCATLCWADQRTRLQRVYLITSCKVREINKILKTKHLPIDRFLQFNQTRHGVSFDRHPFFSLDHLSNPDLAVQALKQAQEASQ